MHFRVFSPGPDLRDRSTGHFFFRSTGMLSNRNIHKSVIEIDDGSYNQFGPPGPSARLRLEVSVACVREQTHHGLLGHIRLSLIIMHGILIAVLCDLACLGGFIILILPSFLNHGVLV